MLAPGAKVRFVEALTMTTSTTVARGAVATMADPDGCWVDDLANGRLAVELADGNTYYVDTTDVEEHAEEASAGWGWSSPGWGWFRTDADCPAADLTWEIEHFDDDRPEWTDEEAVAYLRRELARINPVAARLFDDALLQAANGMPNGEHVKLLRPAMEAIALPELPPSDLPTGEE